MGWSTVAIVTAASLPDLLNALNVTALEKVSFSHIQNRKTVC